MKLSALLVAVFLVSGCTSTFKTSKFNLKEWKPEGESVEGIVYYEPHQVRVTYTFTALVKKDDGSLIGTAEEGKCARVIQKQEIVIEPNFAAPRVLINVPGPLATSKLSVTLSNGMLTAVNTESSPRTPEMIKEVTGFLKEAGLVPLVALDGRSVPACNSAPVITSKEPFPG